MWSFSNFYDLLFEEFDTVSQFLLDPAHSTKTFDDVVAEFQGSGGRILGRGAFGKVFSHPSWPYVLKVFPRDDCYLKFVRYAYSNPSPSFPKFYGVPRKVRPMFTRGLDMAEPYVVRIEKLVPLDQSNGYDMARDIEEMLIEVIAVFKENPKRFTESALASLFDTHSLKYYDILKAGLELKVAHPDCQLDIHYGNIMKRPGSGELVLSDPVWSGRGSRDAHNMGIMLQDVEHGMTRVRPGKRHSSRPNRYKRKRIEKKEKRGPKTYVYRGKVLNVAGEVPATSVEIYSGDYLKCVDDTQAPSLTKDTIYRVQYVNDSGTRATVTGDDGYDRTVFLSRFTKLELALW